MSASGTPDGVSTGHLPEPGAACPDVRPLRPRLAVIAHGVAVLTLLTLLPASASGSPAPPPPDDPGRVLAELLAPRAAPGVPGVVHRGFTTTIPDPRGGPIRGDVVEADLTVPGLRVDLLRPPAVAATAPVPAMAETLGAVAGINGGFFDMGGTGAPVAAQVVDGAPRASGVPVGRRPAPPTPPGESPDTVIGVDGDGVGHVGRVVFRGSVRSGSTEVPLRGLNGYAVPVGGVEVFTPAWGAVSRAGTVCGSDTDPRAGCSRDVVEVRVSGGEVSAVGPPGAGTLPNGTVALVGREAGAAALRELDVGDRATVRYDLSAPDTPPLRTALGALPLARDGRVLPGLQTSERAPRTAAGFSADGRRLWLVTVDGREETSVGATLAQLARLVTDLGVRDAVALDGGGSTTMVHRGRGEPLTVVNRPSDGRPRAVTDGLAVVAR